MRKHITYNGLKNRWEVRDKNEKVLFHGTLRYCERIIMMLKEE